MANTILEVKNINKSFSGNKVLKNISLDIIAGEVHTIVGENGAGKSTLMKIIGGIYSKDSGSVHLDGEEVFISTPSEALANGISIVHQELSLAANVSIAQNIFCHREPTNKLGLIQWKELNKKAQEVLNRIGLDIDPSLLARDVNVATQQLVEIAKAVSRDVRILIMDEPTSSLSEKEVEYLYHIIELLKKQKVSIIFISHKLQEVFKISDRISVLRDGELIGTVSKNEISMETVIHMMVGRHLDGFYPKKSEWVGEPIFEAKALTRKPVFEDVSFTLHKGEILGFAGLVGAGRTEILRALFGADKLDSGEIKLEGKLISIKTCQNAIAQGIGYVTEDRKLLGLFQSMSSRWNIVSSSLEKHKKRFGLIDFNKIGTSSKTYFKLMDIRPNDDQLDTINLSGGNQQKVLMAKWLCANPKVLIVDEPTRGVDIGAKSQIHNYLRKLVEDGVGVIVISSEQPEVIGLCDRILVVAEGKITKDFDNRKTQVTQEEIMKYAVIKESYNG
jgi:ABC-type sugar transport system ATPase subunit